MMPRDRSKVEGLLAAVLCAVFLITAVFGGTTAYAADKWPRRTVEVVIGFPPGGFVDMEARLIAPMLQERLGGTWIVVNKTGAAGSLAATEVAGSTNDHTLLITSEGLSSWPVMGVANLGHKELSLISILGQPVDGISVPANSRFNTVEEFVAEAKANPGKIKVGIAGPGNIGQILGLLMEKYLGTKFNFITFQGGPPAVAAAVGGHVDAIMEPLAIVIEQYKGKKLKILAVFEDEPIQELPEVPTMASIDPSLKGRFLCSYYAMLTPSGMPEAIRKTVTEGVRSVTKTGEWQKKVRSHYIRPLGLMEKDGLKYLDDWTRGATWLLYEKGIAKKSPEEFKISKPEK